MAAAGGGLSSTGWISTGRGGGGGGAVSLVGAVVGGVSVWVGLGSLLVEGTGDGGGHLLGVSAR